MNTTCLICIHCERSPAVLGVVTRTFLVTLGTVYDKVLCGFSVTTVTLTAVLHASVQVFMTLALGDAILRGVVAGLTEGHGEDTALGILHTLTFPGDACNK